MNLPNTLIASENVKDAALYSEFVIPIGAAWEDYGDDHVSVDKLLRSLVSADVLANAKFMAFLRTFLGEGQSPLELLSSDDTRISSDDLAQWSAEKLFAGVAWRMGTLCSELYLSRADQYAFFGSSEPQQPCTYTADFVSTMIRLKLVDTAAIKWETVFAIREDLKARMKLRRLRLLFHKDYSGKSIAYVQDDILSKIDDYESVVRDYRLETLLGSLEMLLSSKWLPAVIGCSLAAALFGQPAIAAISAITGACVEVGKVSVAVAKRRQKMNTLLRGMAVGYILDAKREEPGE